MLFCRAAVTPGSALPVTLVLSAPPPNTNPLLLVCLGGVLGHSEISSTKFSSRLIGESAGPSKFSAATPKFNSNAGTLKSFCISASATACTALSELQEIEIESSS
jgi:hypothetical protein